MRGIETRLCAESVPSRSSTEPVIAVEHDGPGSAALVAESTWFGRTGLCGRTTYSASSSTSYVLATVDLGKAIKVKVTGAAQGYNNGARYSHSTAKVVKA